jgi:hypothetical protein
VNTIGREASLAYTVPLSAALPKSSVAWELPRPMVTVTAGLSRPYVFGSPPSGAAIDFICALSTRPSRPSTVP